MDRSSGLIALAFALWAVCLACNCEKVSSRRYLNFPTDLSTDFHQKIAAALKKIVIKRPYASMEWFAKAIEKADEETDNETDRQVYSDLIVIGNGFLGGRLSETFLSICAQADGDPASGLQPWKDYLEYIGNKHSSSFLEIVLKHGSWITHKIKDIEREMDRVFAAALNIKGDIRVEADRLAEKLSEFDPATDKTFNAKKMIKEIRRITRNESTEDFTLFKNYLLERCGRFMAHEDLNGSIIRIDLLRYFYDSYFVPESALRLLDEYNRLCLALETPNTSDLIRDNLNERLKRNCFGI